jgi:hypothetical protein
MTTQRHAYLADDFERVFGDYQRTPPWRLMLRLRLLAGALGLLRAYVAELDAVRAGQINASRRRDPGQ